MSFLSPKTPAPPPPPPPPPNPPMHANSSVQQSQQAAVQAAAAAAGLGYSGTLKSGAGAAGDTKSQTTGTASLGK